MLVADGLAGGINRKDIGLHGGGRHRVEIDGSDPPAAFNRERHCTAVAADAGLMWNNDGRGQRRGNNRIDRIAAGSEHLQADFFGSWLATDRAGCIGGLCRKRATCKETSRRCADGVLKLATRDGAVSWKTHGSISGVNLLSRFIIKRNRAKGCKGAKRFSPWYISSR